MTRRQRSHPGFDALVDCIVRDLEEHGITLTPELVHDELRLMLRRPEAAGGLPERERLDLLGPQACHRLADRLRAQLRLPDLARVRAAHAGDDDVPLAPDGTLEREPCPVIDLDARRRSHEGPWPAPLR